MKTMMLMLCFTSALAAEVPARECQNHMLGWMFAYSEKSLVETGCYYDLTGVTPYQKIKGGYLLTALPGVGRGRRPIYLETPEDLPEDAILEGRATYAGTYSYQSLTGFDVNVPRFVAVTVKAIRTQ